MQAPTKYQLVVNLKTVKALGLVAFRYTHNAKEVWSGNALQSLASTTDDNGRKFVVRIQRGANGLMVERVSPPNTMAVSAADQGTVVMPPEIKHEVQPFSMLPTSNWNMGQVGQSVLLNTQYGIPFHTQVTPMGREAVRPVIDKNAISDEREANCRRTAQPDCP